MVRKDIWSGNVCNKAYMENSKYENVIVVDLTHNISKELRHTTSGLV